MAAASPSVQAYVDEFKFQSILADDFLEFYLEYFPELKKKGVDSIPGELEDDLVAAWWQGGTWSWAFEAARRFVVQNLPVSS